jgi:xanthine/uracil permease
MASGRCFRFCSAAFRISYDQNVGAISLTGVASRFVVALSGAILVGMAFVPKIAAVIGMVPPFVLGGTLVFMFGMIAVVGIQIISQCMKDQRDVVIVAASIGLSAVINFAPASAFEMFPASVRMLTGDGIVIGTLTAVILNLILVGRLSVQTKDVQTKDNEATFPSSRNNR